MAVVTKVTSKVTLSVKTKVQEKGNKKIEKESSKKIASSVRPDEDTDKKDEGGQKSTRSRKYCHFCKTRSEPKYWDAQNLRKFLNDRGRIYARTRSGACAKHQRRISREIKRARHLALLPFTVKI